MKSLIGILACAMVAISLSSLTVMGQKGGALKQPVAESTVKLPEPKLEGTTSLEYCLANRRSVRSFTDEAFPLNKLSQMLWAAQGITNSRGFRTAPSAGALYPLELYVVAGNIIDLSKGLYRYRPKTHDLKEVSSGDKREELWEAGLKQSALREAPAVFIFAGVFDRTTAKYGKRGLQYVMIEVGHAAQNLSLQAVSSGLGTVPIGAFDDNAVKRILDQSKNVHPLYLMPAGVPAR